MTEDVRGKLVELLNKQKGMTLPIWTASQTVELMADALIAHGVTVQKHGYWEEVVEIKDNTACGDGVQIRHKRCSCCKQPMGFMETTFCSSCGAMMDGNKKGGNN